MQENNYDADDKTINFSIMGDTLYVTCKRRALQNADICRTVGFKTNFISRWSIENAMFCFQTEYFVINTKIVLRMTHRFSQGALITI